MIYKFEQEFAHHLAEAKHPNFVEVRMESHVPCVYFNSRGALCRQPIDLLFGGEKFELGMENMLSFTSFSSELTYLVGVVGVGERKKKKTVILDSRANMRESAIKLRGLEDPLSMACSPFLPYNVCVKDGNQEGKRTILKLFDLRRPEYPVKLFGLGNKETRLELEQINAEALVQ